MGFGEITFAWNADPKWGILAISIAASWQFTGYIMSLYLAGLRGISEEIREAALVDGAGTWALYRHIIIPLLTPVTIGAETYVAFAQNSNGYVELLREVGTEEAKLAQRLELPT